MEAAAMSWRQVVVLAVLQGLTEFLPDAAASFTAVSTVAAS
ncbi:MAG TPA: hypothetical protein VKG81_02955 [Mycobacterium sp.]|nr:hypothetical protein [Mycobacterium sp.]HME47083.1 hypothetical protein [Mycobacterium sp.]